MSELDEQVAQERQDTLNRAAAGSRDVLARLRAVRAMLSGRLCLTTSFGVEDQLLTFYAAQCQGFEIVTLDTGKLFAETRATWMETERHFGLAIAAARPAAAAVAALVARDGEDGYYASVAQRRACCGVRKTEPLERALRGAEGWITGLRAEQSAERAAVGFAEIDRQRGLLKINPLYDWPRHAVIAELAAHGVPTNTLEGRGYRSIGCEPCTRAVRPGEPERAGRWWWEDAAAKECGLHAPAASQAA